MVPVIFYNYAVKVWQHQNGSVSKLVLGFKDTGSSIMHSCSPITYGNPSALI